MSNEDPKYIKMLAQMGLTPEIVPDDMKQSLMDKLGLSKPSDSSKPKSKDRSGSGDQAESKKERVDGRKKRKSKKTREVEKKDRE